MSNPPEPSAQQLKGLQGLPSLYGMAPALSHLNVGGIQYPAGGGADPTKAGTPSNNLKSILDAIKGYNVNQMQGSGAAGLAKTLAGEIGNLPEADYAVIMKQLAGTPLGTDVSNIINPPQSNKNAQNFGFDPLSLGQMFSTTIVPWLAQQQKLGNQEQGALAQQMQSAMSGASPAMQQVMKMLIPSQEAAQGTLNEALTANIGTGAEQDALIQQLAQATQAAKLAQGAAQAEPYWAATTGTGSVPTTGAYGNAQSALNAIQQQILGATAATH